MGNIFDRVPGGPDTPGAHTEEFVESLVRATHTRIERIVSRGQHSPDGVWYDQEENEWVLLLSGRARLAYRDSDDVISLEPGDYVDIPAHRKHRVEWTDPDQDTVWLAVFY